jgi:hypothetical protein
LKDRIRILPVFEGKTLLNSPEAAARQYARRNQVPFEMVVDPDEKVAVACGTAGRDRPYSILVDPKGVVRLTDVGHMSTRQQSSKLADSLTAFFMGSKPDSMPLLLWERYIRAPDIPVILQGGKQTRLSRLSGTRPLVITFLTDSSLPALQRIHAIRNFAKASQVRFLFVLRSPSVKPARLGEGDGVLVAEQNTEALFTAFKVRNGPVSVILHHGRAVFGEAAPQQLGEIFERELAYAVFLVGSEDRSRRRRSLTPGALDRAAY